MKIRFLQKSSCLPSVETFECERIFCEGDGFLRIPSIWELQRSGGRIHPESRGIVFNLECFKRNQPIASAITPIAIKMAPISL